MIKAIIIDDERLARNELKKLLMDFPEIEVVAEAANAGEGIEKIENINPDLVFLDIQMPGKTGFDMLSELDKAPHVIFTTAYDEYALKAFEVNALEERLDEKTFFRANRKHIVNLRMIEKIEPYFNGGLLLELKGGEKIEVSRRQTVKFKEMMSL